MPLPIVERIAAFERAQEKAAQAGTLARTLAVERSAWFDALIADLWRGAISGSETTERMAVVAVGGYGRGELSPRSDLDLLFLTPRPQAAAVRRVADAILYPLWDLKLSVGHAVRSPAESLAFAKRDFQTCTALLELRVIAGDGAFAREMAADVSRWVGARGLTGFLVENRRAMAARHERFGGTPHLLEPDVKQSPGGLRDLHTALWATQARFGICDGASLLHEGLISERQAELLARAEEFFLRVRAAMHRATGRKEDHFTYDLQDALFPALGYSADEAARESGAERCLRDYYSHARAVLRVVPELLDRVGDRAKPTRAAKSRPIGASPFVAKTPNARSREDFIALLCDATDKTRAVSKLHNEGLLCWVIPEFRGVECRVQRDLYHVYTVDTHLVFAVERLKEVVRGEWVDREPFFSALAQDVELPVALFLGVLLHDVGKGAGGDHSERGAAMAAGIAERFQLDEVSAAHLVFLVREHLLLMRTAQRRDLEDDDVIREVAGIVGSERRLRDLALLSFVDSSTTSPSVWTPWKSALLVELTERVAAALSCQTGEPHRAPARVDAERMNTNVPPSDGRTEPRDDGAAVFTSSRGEVSSDGIVDWTVRCSDLPGRLAMIAGALSAAGIDILSARIFTRHDANGTEIEDRIIARLPEHLISAQLADAAWQRAEQTLTCLLRGEMSIDEVARSAAPERGPLARPTPFVETRVDVVNRSSQRYSIVEIRCLDRRGLLFVIARALANLNTTIALAKISTEGGRANDAFYVTTMGGEKIADTAMFAEELRRRIVAFLST